MAKFFTLALVVLLAGCSMTQGGASLTQLQFRVADLENQLQDKDQQIMNLQQEIRTLTADVDRLSARTREQAAQKYSSPKITQADVTQDEGVIRVSASPQEVQAALQKAGHYQGAIDGKIGAQTQKAIASFQKDRGLKVDGIVGAKTWNELKSYLD